MRSEILKQAEEFIDDYSMNKIIEGADPSGEYISGIRSFAMMLDQKRNSFIKSKDVDTRAVVIKNSFQLLENKVKINAWFPDQIKYPYDGYGRLSRAIHDNSILDKDSRIRVFFGHPADHKKRFSNDINVFFTMFEADKIPTSWVENINLYADHVIVPSQFCKETFINSGVTKPIDVLNLFVDSAMIYNKEPRPFIFAHQNSFVEGAQKGYDLVMRAFLNVFHKIPDNEVMLLLKGRNHRWANDNYYLDLAKQEKKIKVILEDMNEETLEEEFWKKIDCFVYPSRGEGFGLPPLEAMSRGIPTILTNAHSHTEFVKFGLPVGVKGKTKAYYVGRVWDYGIGDWVEPDIKDIEVWMWKVFNSYSDYKKRAVEFASTIQKEFSLESFLNKLKDILERINGRN